MSIFINKKVEIIMLH